MTIYNIYIFDRFGNTLYYTEWLRAKQSGLTKANDAKLMQGFIAGLKAFLSKISPSDGKNNFFSFCTSVYRLHFFESATGLKIIINTDRSVGSLREELQTIYSNIFVEYIVKNPLCPPHEPITTKLFVQKLDEYIQSLPAYSVK